MSRIVADISVSLDGFVTGPGPDLDHGLGTGGEPLHHWAIHSQDPVDVAALAEATEATGAVIMGRRLFDIIDAPQGWNDDMGYGARHAAVPPVFVLTHQPPSAWRLGARFTFVTSGLDEAIRQARAAAGERDVVVMGGGDTVRQAVVSGAAEELRLHLAPILLGSGTPLFRHGEPRALRLLSVRQSPHTVHLAYAVDAGGR
jgi:dihydrofolate reductase